MIEYSMSDYGIYSVGEYQTFSKLDAIERSAVENKSVEWHFNDAYFSSLDWTVEPEETLGELYRQRAQQIRESYDYVVLFYSGGADSANILTTFINNGIKLDEVAHFCSYEGDKDRHSWFNVEITNVAIPNTKSLLQLYPYIKHRVIDQSSLVTDVYNMPGVKNDFLYMNNTLLSPNNFSRFYLRKFVRDYADMIAAGKRICFVYGSEKPRLHYIDGKYCFRFQDMIDNCMQAILQQQNNPGYYDEMFYWSKYFSKGLIKQSHTIMNALKTAQLPNVDFRLEKHVFGSTVRGDTTWYLTTNGLHKLIYPEWDISTFSIGKPASPIMSPRDGWYLTSSHNTNLSSTQFLAGIKHLDDQLSTINAGFWKNGRRLFDGIKGCVSPPYFLE